MDFELLQNFYYIAKYKNITRAAKHLYVNQSTLSRQIKALESELGVQLINRDKKQIELTEAGETFYKDSASFIEHMDAMIKNVQSVDKGHSGTLRVTVPNHLYYLLEEPLDAMAQQYPDMQLIIESYLFNEIPSAIQYNQYNVGFTYDFMLRKEDELMSIPIQSDDFSLIVPLSCLTEENQTDVNEIVKHLPLFLPSYAEPPFLKGILSILQEYAGEKSIRVHRVNTTESVILNTSLGLGYGIVPSSMTKGVYSNEGVAYINLPELHTKCSVVMVCKADSTYRPTKHFFQVVKALQTAKQLAF